MPSPSLHARTVVLGPSDAVRNYAQKKKKTHRRRLLCRRRCAARRLVLRSPCKSCTALSTPLTRRVLTNACLPRVCFVFSVTSSPVSMADARPWPTDLLTFNANPDQVFFRVSGISTDLVGNFCDFLCCSFQCGGGRMQVSKIGKRSARSVCTAGLPGSN